jgi:hypothetical protein
MALNLLLILLPNQLRVKNLFYCRFHSRHSKERLRMGRTQLKPGLSKNMACPRIRRVPWDTLQKNAANPAKQRLGAG